MRRLSLILVAVVLVGGAAAIVLGRDPSGPFPSASDLSARGFAAWPVDTVEEAEDECAGAEEWRRDAHATALRFARDVLRYPKPHAGESFGDEDHSVRLLVGSDDERELFLGSVLELDRYGRCWYVTEGVPREGDLGATLGFVYREGRPHLLLGHPLGLPSGYVGWGDWEAEIDPGARQTVMWMPELDPGTTGHAIYTAPDERGVSEMVGARTLGFVPPPPSGPPARRLGVGDVAADEEACASFPSKSPERVIRHLYEWTFVERLQVVKGFPRYERRGFRHLGGDRWRLVVDDAVLEARIPEIAHRCYRLVSMTPVDGQTPLRALRIGELGVTFEIDWRGADEATVAFDGAGGTLSRIREPVTFPDAAPSGSDAPSSARVVLYEDGHVASAWYGLYGS